jgi:alpha-beta hydrolase superfamily lysophospholipase
MTVARRWREAACRLLLAVAAVLAAAPGAQAAARLVSLRAADGTLLSGALFEPDHRPAPAVVLVHMLTRSRADWNDAAERLRRGGFFALAIDLRGHGQSALSGSVPDDLARLAQDVRAAVTFLASNADVMTGRIGLAGASLGANLAVLAAAAEPAVHSLALLSATTDYRGVRIEAALRKVTRPVLLVAGTDDAYAVRSAKVLAGTEANREVDLRDGAGHGTVMLQRYPDLSDRLVDWFRRTLL